MNPPKSSALESIQLFEDHFNFYTLPSLQGQKGLPVILMPDALEMSGSPLSSFLKNNVSTKLKLIECENHETVRALTEEGLGIGLLPDLVARASASRGLLIKTTSSSYPKNLAAHSIALSYLRNRGKEEALTRLREEIARYSPHWVSGTF